MFQYRQTRTGSSLQLLSMSCRAALIDELEKEKNSTKAINFPCYETLPLVNNRIADKWTFTEVWRFWFVFPHREREALQCFCHAHADSAWTALTPLALATSHTVSENEIELLWEHELWLSSWHGMAVRWRLCLSLQVHAAATGCCCFREFSSSAAVDIHKIFHFIVSSVSSSERVALLFPSRQTTNFRCTERVKEEKKQQISHTHENLIYEPKLICKHSARENVQQKRVLNRNFISSSSLFLQPCKSDDVAVRCRSDEAGLPQSLLDLVKVFEAEFPWSARSRRRHSGRFCQVSMMRWCARERDQP